MFFEQVKVIDKKGKEIEKEFIQKKKSLLPIAYPTECLVNMTNPPHCVLSARHISISLYIHKHIHVFYFFLILNECLLIGCNFHNSFICDFINMCGPMDTIERND